LVRERRNKEAQNEETAKKIRALLEKKAENQKVENDLNRKVEEIKVDIEKLSSVKDDLSKKKEKLIAKLAQKPQQVL
jgi:chaperonin cofactor prefoldin